MDPRLQEKTSFFSAHPSQRHLKGKKKHVSDTSFFEWHHALSGAGMLQAFLKKKTRNCDLESPRVWWRCTAHMESKESGVFTGQPRPLAKDASCGAGRLSQQRPSQPAHWRSQSSDAGGSRAAHIKGKDSGVFTGQPRPLAKDAGCGAGWLSQQRPPQQKQRQQHMFVVHINKLKQLHARRKRSSFTASGRRGLSKRKLRYQKSRCTRCTDAVHCDQDCLAIAGIKRSLVNNHRLTTDSSRSFEIVLF